LIPTHGTNLTKIILYNRILFGIDHVNTARINEKERNKEMKSLPKQKKKKPNTKFKKLLVWYLISGGKNHPLLTEKDKQIIATMPIVATLFPGIDYYSMSGFGQVLQECVIPALKKLFPELVSVPGKDITIEEMVEIGEFIPSKGYEWQNSPKWKEKFEKRLVA
jgi:hypothetical protein